MSANDHGPTCGDSPIDHRCEYSRREDAEEDQGVTWREWTHTLGQRWQQIAALHVQTEGTGGTVSGYCAECDRPWPCQTYHIAVGWGRGDGQDQDAAECFATGWCTHASRKVERIYDEAEASTVSQGVDE